MMFKIIKKYKNHILGIIAMLAFISFIISIWLPIFQSFRIVFGSFYVLFLPGFFITHVFFKKDDFDVIERVTLSFTLSIAIVPLIVFYLNLLGVKITALSIFLEVLLIILVPCLIIWHRKLSTVDKF